MGLSREPSPLLPAPAPAEPCLDLGGPQPQQSPYLALGLSSPRLQCSRKHREVRDEKRRPETHQWERAHHFPQKEAQTSHCTWQETTLPVLATALPH